MYEMSSNLLLFDFGAPPNCCNRSCPAAGAEQDWSVIVSGSYLGSVGRHPTTVFLSERGF